MSNRAQLFSLLAAFLLVATAVPAPVSAAPSTCNDLGEYESQEAYQNCLRDNTTAENVTTYVHTPPSNLSQKQIDAVYAISPQHEDEYGFNETQKKHITDWMMWEKVGVKPGWYDSESTEDGEANGTEAESGPAEPLGKPATVAVSQPDYHGSTNTETRDGETVHIVNAQRVEIQPQNFNNDNVVGFGISEGPGDLSYDNQMDEFVFETNGEVGTFKLYWEVEERVRVGNETEMARTRYTATVRADSNATYRHLTQSEVEQRNGDAQNWSAWESALTGIYGDDVNVEQKTQKAESLLRLYAHPLAALSGDFTGLLLALFITLGGMVLLALIGVLHLAARWTDIKYINRFESLKAEERDVDKRLSDLDWREKMRSVAKWDWNDWFGDYASRAYRRISSTPYKGMKKLLSVRRPRNLVDHRAQAMLHDGYVAVVKRDDVATDGGAASADRPIVNAELVHEGYVDDDAETIDPTDDNWDGFLDVLDWGSDALWSYSLAESDASPEDIHVEQAPLALEDLVDALGTETRDFDSRQHWGTYLLEFVEFVRDHEFCDEEGSPDDIQFVLNEWMDTDDFLADAFDLPHFKAESEALEWAVKHSDPVEEADQRVKTATEGRHSDLE